MRTCCYECPDRTIDCHTECEIYKEFVRKKKEISKKERLEKVSGSVRNNNLRYDLWVKKGKHKSCNTKTRE